MAWKCTTKKIYNSADKGEKNIQGTSNVRAEAVLSIQNVECDHDNVVCDCLVTGRLAGKDVSSNKSLLLKFDISVRAVNLTVPTAIYESHPFTIYCSGHARKADQSLQMYTENIGVKSTVVKSDKGMKDSDTCTFAVSISKEYTLKRADRGTHVTCMLPDSSNQKRVALDIQYSVKHASLKFDGVALKTAETKTVKEGAAYTILCEADSNPAPVIDLDFTRTGDTKKTKSQLLNGKISREAKISHAGKYECSAKSHLTNGEKRTATSDSLTLTVTEKTNAGLSTPTLVVAIIVPLLLCLAITGVILYVRRRRAQPDDGAYPEEYYEGQYPDDEAYQPPPTPATGGDKDRRGGSVSARDDASGGITVSISRTGSRARDGDDTRSRAGEVDSRRSSHR